MKKLLLSFLSALFIAAHLLAQKDTAWIAPFYYLEIDSAEWRILFDAPDPIMMYRVPIPQQLVHRETGLVVFFQTAYAMEEPYLKWQLVQKKKSTSIALEVEVKDAEVRQEQYKILFGKVKLKPEENFEKFEACTIGSVKQTMANGFISAQSPCYLLVHSPNQIGPNEQAQLKTLIKHVKTTTAKQLDHVRARVQAEQGHKRYNPKMRWSEIADKRMMSHFSESTSQVNEFTEHRMISSVDTLFSFHQLDSQLRMLCSPKSDPLPIFVQAGLTKKESPFGYLNYHLKEHRRYRFYQDMALFHLRQKFPPGIEDVKLVAKENQDTVWIHEGKRDNKYYILKTTLTNEKAIMQLDSLRVHKLSTRDYIFPNEVGPNLFQSEMLQWQKLTGNDPCHLIFSTHEVKQKDVIATIFEDVHFYRTDLTKNALISLLPPKNLAPYEALVKYSINASDQIVMDLHYAAKDTVRFYHPCELRDSSPQMIFYNGAAGKELSCAPAKRLYGTSLFTTDLNQNGQREYWRFFISNGLVVQTNFYAPSGLDSGINTPANQTKVLSCPQLQNLLRVSKSTAINNHFLTNRNYDDELILSDAEIMNEADLMYDDHTYITRLEKDTTVYEQPSKKGYFAENDYAAQTYLAEQLRHVKLGQLPPPSTKYIVSFIIEKDGSLSKVNARCLSQTTVPILEEKLLQIVKAMPNWNPATVSGIPVRSFGAVHFGIYVK